MNKENSFGIDNEQSTETNSLVKGYSSRYNHIKHKREKERPNGNQHLPYKLEKAALVIQKHWRFCMAMRRLVYQEFNEELVKTTNILQFQNQCLDRIIQAKRQQLERTSLFLHKKSAIKMSDQQKIAMNLIKQCVATTFKIQRKTPSRVQLELLEEQVEQIELDNQELTNQVKYLQMKKAEELQAEEEAFLMQINEENSRLLHLSKIRMKLEWKLKQKQIESAKFDAGLL